MNSATQDKLQKIAKRYEEIQVRLADPQIISAPQQMRKLSIELAEIKSVVHSFAEYERLAQQLAETKQMLSDQDVTIQEMAKEELPTIEQSLKTCEAALQSLLLPKERNDHRNIFLEIRAGIGGDEAALFVGDLFKMYHTYAESQRWKVEIMSHSDGEHGGYKEIISRVAGANVYSRLKFESGTHRVQRVPETESQGRIHTSACTVAVLVEADEMDEIEINPVDIRIDTYRSSGAGGQHVNKTDSAIRITHLPSGIVVECQDQRSQHKNRARAMAALKSQLLAAEMQKQQQQEANTRKSLVGSGDRSQRIRTYNFPRGRVTDHRIGLTLYKLESILAGDIDVLIDLLIAEQRANLLAAPQNA